MLNTDNRLLTRESSEHIREFFSTVERLSVSMERLFAGRSPAMAGENFYTDRELAEKLLDGCYRKARTRPEEL